MRCRYNHDVPGYLAAKPPDLHLPLSSQLSASPPFISEPSSPPTIVCPVHAELGECKYVLHLNLSIHLLHSFL